VLRRREPHVDRPFKAWGYPVLPLFFVVASAAMMAMEARRIPGPTLAGLGVIVAGLPFYFLFVVRARRR
jgi:basic amino acid/polyamine antiporter, APA family